ncbi:hypothetical protein KY386_02425 [Candidatus Parcubacteria bacterium]|nr:hypothetical protein [Candidatus Parcubacteria bacterium]
MSSGNGSGGAFGTFVGMGLLYWMAVAMLGMAAFVVLGVLLVIAVGAALLYGVLVYLGAAGDAVASGDRDEIARLVVAPMAILLGVLVGLFLIEVVGVIDTGLVYYYIENPWAAMGFVKGFLLVLCAVTMSGGYIVAGYFSYSREDAFLPGLLWFYWGFSWSIGFGWDGFGYLVNDTVRSLPF